MNQKIFEQIDGLLEKYTDLLLGEANPDLKEKVKAWIIFTHISKSMPPLIQHFNGTYPDAKDSMKQIIAEIKALNEAKKAK